MKERIFNNECFNYKGKGYFYIQDDHGKHIFCECDFAIDKRRGTLREDTNSYFISLTDEELTNAINNNEIELW